MGQLFEDRPRIKVSPLDSVIGGPLRASRRTTASHRKPSAVPVYLVYRTLCRFRLVPTYQATQSGVVVLFSRTPSYWLRAASPAARRMADNSYVMLTLCTRGHASAKSHLPNENVNVGVLPVV